MKDAYSFGELVKELNINKIYQKLLKDVYKEERFLC